MKFLIALAVFTIASSSSFACQSLEAQFSGKVKETKIQIKNDKTVECSFKIEFEKFNSSVVCPLDIDEVFNQEFQDKNCNLKDGDSISGYMTKSEDKIVIE